MVKEMVGLGFGHIELSHGIRITLVPGILRAVEEGLVRIGSTHNFCPLPTGITQAAPNLFEPSAVDSREHDQWLRHTKRSLDFAAQVKARVMVLHLGRTRFFWFHPARRIHHYLEAHPGAGRADDDPAYRKLLARALARLRARMGPYWERVLASLEEIREHAVDKGVALGCENREKFDELPVDTDFGDLFATLTTPHTAGYWHDTGHAHLKEEMGLLRHREHLEKNADRLLGFHLHDVDDGHDHQPVGSGRIDFGMVSTFWKPHHLLVLELSPRVDTEGVLASKARIEALMR